MKGEVVSTFLKGNSLTHSLTLKVGHEEIENLKVQVKDGPSHNQSAFRWPFEDTAIKFVSKVDLDKDFTPIYDEDGGEELVPEDQEEGTNVMVKFTPIFYLGRKAKGSDAGFAPGLSLRLNAVHVVSKGQAFANLTFESPSKRQKVKGSESGG